MGYSHRLSKNEPRPTGERAGLGRTLIGKSSGREGSRQILDALAYTDLTAAIVLQKKKQKAVYSLKRRTEQVYGLTLRLRHLWYLVTGTSAYGCQKKRN